MPQHTGRADGAGYRTGGWCRIMVDRSGLGDESTDKGKELAAVGKEDGKEDAGKDTEPV